MRDSGLILICGLLNIKRTAPFTSISSQMTLPIKKVNGFMASCLASEMANGVEVLRDIITEKYNGVDVKKVDKNRRSLIGYLTKYITKNEIEFTHLPLHCSRDVSRLFTTINFEREDMDKYFDQIPDL